MLKLVAEAAEYLRPTPKMSSSSLAAAAANGSTNGDDTPSPWQHGSSFGSLSSSGHHEDEAGGVSPLAALRGVDDVRVSAGGAASNGSNGKGGPIGTALLGSVNALGDDGAAAASAGNASAAAASPSAPPTPAHAHTAANGNAQPVSNGANGSAMMRDWFGDAQQAAISPSTLSLSTPGGGVGEVARLFVYGIPASAMSDGERMIGFLRQHFQRFGAVLTVDITRGPNDAASCAFVDFASREAAEKWYACWGGGGWLLTCVRIACVRYRLVCRRARSSSTIRHS
jgi:hypothetical protein